MDISSGIIEAGADAVGDMPSTMFISVFSITAQLVMFGFWLFVLAQFLSLNIAGKSSSTFL